MKYALLSLTCILTLALHAQPTISFTFDDGSMGDFGTYKFEDWNEMILRTLDSADVKAIFFVKTAGKDTPRGRQLLRSWDEHGHGIANHTQSHPNFNRPEISAADFERELLRADALIAGYANYTKFFRFPYLKEGNSPEKVDSIRSILAEHGYRNGYVTIDASDWYIDGRLRDRLAQDPQADLTGFRDFYLEHLFDRALYYERLAFEMTGRHVKHTILLHHNLAAALFLDDLIALFEARGWAIASASEAYRDPMFRLSPKHAGESLIWALAKDSDEYEGELRYPAEDGSYEAARMDELGL